MYKEYKNHQIEIDGPYIKISCDGETVDEIFDATMNEEECLADVMTLIDDWTEEKGETE